VLSGLFMWVATQMPCLALAGSISQPGIWQGPAVTSGVHVVLGGTGVHMPVVGLQPWLH